MIVTYIYHIKEDEFVESLFYFWPHESVALRYKPARYCCKLVMRGLVIIAFKMLFGAITT